MGYKFKPSSATFYCPGFSSFSTYLSAVGITTDSDGYLDTDDFLVTRGVSSTVGVQHKDYYAINNTSGLYGGILESGYSGAYIGYITIPFYINGANSTLKLVLPGTAPQMSSFHTIRPADGWVTISRSSTYLTIGSVSYGTTNFADGVIPVFIAVDCLGGGGGGSSSGTYAGEAEWGVTSGAGGGGGGYCTGIINLCAYSTIYCKAGAGGSAGVKTDGGAGGNTVITTNINAATICVAYGGTGGTSANATGTKGSVGGTGGSYASTFSSSVYKGSSSNGNSWSAWSGTSGGNGGQGGHGAGGAAQKAVAGSGAGASGYIRATPFNWPPNGNSYSFKLSASSGGSVSGNEGGGGGGASQYGNGGSGNYNSSGSSGGAGAGGAGGDFKTGTWNDGGKGGDGWIYLYY